jgi:hypothetical protein
VCRCGDKDGGVCVRFACEAQQTRQAKGKGVWVRGEGRRTLDTNVNVVLLTLLDLAGIFIRFRERVESFEILD